MVNLIINDMHICANCYIRNVCQIYQEKCLHVAFFLGLRNDCKELYNYAGTIKHGVYNYVYSTEG